MNIYISGISGTGMGPLALMAKQAGHTVFGSDRGAGPIISELENAQIDFKIGPQDGKFLGSLDIDWFVYTSALPKDHPELKLAQQKGIKCSKRDEFIEFLVKELNLKMVAIAGTHGKTTTTSMLIWAAKQLGLKSAYLVGTTLGFAKSGSYNEGDQFFIYEADEYDRNFLHYQPWLSLITFVSYDHPDIYPSESDYHQAFLQFENQSQSLIFANPAAAPSDLSQLSSQSFQILKTPDPRLTLAGSARREDANLVFYVIKQILADQPNAHKISDQQIIDILNQFPGVGRRFERLSDGLYSDYAHHPEEIRATVEIAKEEAKNLGKNGVVVVYQPHQNTRQHEVFSLYRDVFLGVDQLFWLPTYLTRENPELKIYAPIDFINTLTNSEIATSAELDDQLKVKLKSLLQDNYLVILMSAGPADQWFRDNLI